MMMESGLVDLVDIELFMGDAEVKATVAKAQNHQVKVVMCNHDFDKTPPKRRTHQPIAQNARTGSGYL